MSVAAVLLAAALLATVRPAARMRIGLVPARSQVRPKAGAVSDVLAVAAGLEVFALCLSAGMPVSGAAAVTARQAPPQVAAILRHGAELLALGAEPDVAWAVPHRPVDGSVEPTVTAVLRLARRSGSSGSALAAGLGELAVQCRLDASHAARADSERAGVLIAGPLGLCFLPAFVCLGIVPVVAGLAGDILRSGLL